MAREATEIIATAASPWIFVFLPLLRRRIAAIIVIGSTRYILFVRFRTVAILIAPKATWLKPSPIKLKRLRTSVTPRREEQREIRTPTIKAYRTKGKLKY